MSVLDTIQAAIVAELVDATNSTGIVAANYDDEPAIQRAGTSGSITAYVFTEDSEVDHEGNQYFFEDQRLYISLYSRRRGPVHDAADVVKALFYKATPLANIRTAGADYMLFRGMSNPMGNPAGGMRVDIAFSLHYQTSYTT